MAVHDGLGQSCRPRREQHIQRMHEIHLLEDEVAGFGEQFVPGQRGLEVRTRVRHGDGVGEARQGGPYRRDIGRPVDKAVTGTVTRDRHQDLRSDLAPAVLDRTGSELRGARGEHGPEARAGEQEHQSLGDVGQIRRHPVPPPHSEVAQSAPGPRDLVAELVGGECHGLPGLRVPEHHGRRAQDARHLQDPLGVVQPSLGKPLDVRHGGRVDERGGRDVRGDLEVLPQGRPEARQVRHGPAPQGGVVVEVEPVTVFQPSQVRADAGPVEYVGGRAPQRGVSGHTGSPRGE